MHIHACVQTYLEARSLARYVPKSGLPYIHTKTCMNACMHIHACIHTHIQHTYTHTYPEARSLRVSIGTCLLMLATLIMQLITKRRDLKLEIRLFSSGLLNRFFEKHLCAIVILADGRDLALAVLLHCIVL